jgi:hypothetical protein
MKLLLCALAMLAALFMPFRKNTPTFRSVTAELDLKQVKSDADYVIIGNDLYLRFQTTYPALVLVMGVDIEEWSPDRLQALLKEHPELKTHLPDPNRPDGGISWLK